MYAAVDWLSCYEPGPDDEDNGNRMEEVSAWLLDLANAKNEKEFRAEVRKQAIEEIAKERGMTKREVRAALKRVKQGK